MMSRIRAFALVSVAGFSGLATSASAETLTVSGVRPAQTDAGLGVFTVSIDRIAGRDGSKLEFELKQALDRVQVGGDDWFEIVPIGGGEVDAIIGGSAGSRTSRTELDQKEVESCAQKDKDKKCIRYKVTYYDCTRYEASFYPDIEIVGYEGDILYAARDELSATRDHCEDESNRPRLSSMTNGLVGDFVRTVRHALAPRATRNAYRVLERRKGLQKADRKTFKSALKLTKTDEDAACEAFKSLEAGNPDQTSVLFNIGMCLEREGAYDEAASYYDRVNVLEDGKLEAREGLRRIAMWKDGLRQLEIRQSYYAPAPNEEGEAPTGQ